MLKMKMTRLKIWPAPSRARLIHSRDPERSLILVIVTRVGWVKFSNFAGNECGIIKRKGSENLAKIFATVATQSHLWQPPVELSMGEMTAIQV